MNIPESIKTIFAFRRNQPNEKVYTESWPECGQCQHFRFDQKIHDELKLRLTMMVLKNMDPSDPLAMLKKANEIEQSFEASPGGRRYCQRLRSTWTAASWSCENRDQFEPKRG